MQRRGHIDGMREEIWMSRWRDGRNEGWREGGVGKDGRQARNRDGRMGKG